MKTRLVSEVLTCLSVALMLAAAPGCKKEEPGQTKPAGEDISVKKVGAADAKGKVTVKVKMEAKLARADSFDGKTDKVVSKCPSCALGMDGSSAHALKVSGYELHFCSADCKTGFEKDTTKAVLALKIPRD